MHLFQERAATDPDAALAQIPIVDFAPYFSGDETALEPLADRVRQACETIGFLYLKGHGVPRDLIDRTFAASRRFHALPPEEKMKLKLDAFNVGYLPMNASTQRHSTVHKATRPNQNESFFINQERAPDHPDVVNKTPLRGMNYWPESLPGFREDVLAYHAAVNALGQRTLPVFARALGMPADHFGPMFADENHATLRLLHYPPTDQTGNDFGQGPHTDNSFLTFLMREDVPGLSVRLPSGEWVQPPVLPDTYLVNLGNIMRRMSNDRFLSTPHGVVVEGDKDRYSIAYFHSPNVNQTISVLPSCVDAEHPAKYPDAVYRDLVLEFFAANYAHQKNYAKADMPNRYA